MHFPSTKGIAARAATAALGFALVLSQVPAAALAEAAGTAGAQATAQQTSAEAAPDAATTQGKPAAAPASEGEASSAAGSTSATPAAPDAATASAAVPVAAATAATPVAATSSDKAAPRRCDGRAGGRAHRERQRVAGSLLYRRRPGRKAHGQRLHHGGRRLGETRTRLPSTPPPTRVTRFSGTAAPSFHTIRNLIPIRPSRAQRRAAIPLWTLTRILTSRARFPSRVRTALTASSGATTPPAR
jgi:hypothetical protein